MRRSLFDWRPEATASIASHSYATAATADHISLLIFFAFFLYVLGQPSIKKLLRLCRFTLDRHEIWHDCSLTKYASIDGVGFLI